MVRNNCFSSIDKLHFIDECVKLGETPFEALRRICRIYVCPMIDRNYSIRHTQYRHLRIATSRCLHHVSSKVWSLITSPQWVHSKSSIASTLMWNAQARLFRDNSLAISAVSAFDLLICVLFICLQCLRRWLLLLLALRLALRLLRLRWRRCGCARCLVRLGRRGRILLINAFFCVANFRWVDVEHECGFVVLCCVYDKFYSSNNT